MEDTGRDWKIGGEEEDKGVQAKAGEVMGILQFARHFHSFLHHVRQPHSHAEGAVRRSAQRTSRRFILSRPRPVFLSFSLSPSHFSFSLLFPFVPPAHTAW